MKLTLDKVTFKLGFILEGEQHARATSDLVPAEKLKSNVVYVTTHARDEAREKYLDCVHVDSISSVMLIQRMDNSWELTIYVRGVKA